ncbi:epidermal growth factor receptor kinase substrate 8-like protein 1 isoform X2 [Thalassophryne amazonica]|uniref:epidermal growth factor receptor kinase substrate 8-like protein 1 isoform X2 n=1 Tax=Thalassophryne amazonica TaxID=390379 RepID=UPI001470ADBF|nr:epidermal growth factor receptor kinase substrate 8-like protein 1 isoform X2 [Thalassophryne amazonica]
MTNISRYLVNHLLTFSLQNGEVQNVEEAQARLSFLAQNKKLWSQEMFLNVGPDAIHLRDTKSQEELENYSFRSIFRCEAIHTEKHFPSLLLLVCQSTEQKKPDIHFFNCDTVQAEQICDDITRAVSDSSSSSRNTLRATFRRPQTTGEMIDPYNIPSHPVPHAPNPPPGNPPPYPGRRANRVNGGPDFSYPQAEREVGILNHCFDDIESFMGKLQQTAEAATELSQTKKKKKRKSKKNNAEEDLLAAKACPPAEAEFIDIFQKIKYCFSLLARLKSFIANPSSEELVHHVFKPLDMMVKTTGGPAMGASVSSPAMTNSAVSLLQDNLKAEEHQLWTSLGPNWTQPCSQLRDPVAPYTPVFLDGWKPEPLRPDGQAWEDPIESQHKKETLQVKQQQQPPQQVVLPNTHISDKTDGGSPPPESERLYSCSYDFIARNSSELSVQQGETLEVIESSKRWWKCRNRFNQVGFVPFNILEPVAHIDSPVATKPPNAPVPPPLAKQFNMVPPSPPVQPKAPSPQRPRSLPPYNQHVPPSGDSDKAISVNEELLQKLTNGKANLNKPLVIPRSSDTSAPLNYHSPPEEVAEWLRTKGFSDPTVSCLGVLTGAQLFSLNKEELRAVIPEEGTRVYSQLAVQKALLEDVRKATELETVMEIQKQKVDLKLESSTL